MKIKLIIIFISTSLVSCNVFHKKPITVNNDAVTFDQFPTTQKIDFKPLIEYNYGYPRDLKLINDTSLIVLNYGKVNIPWYTVLDSRNGKELQSFGKYGNGPDEALFVPSFGFQNGKMWAYDATKSNILLWDSITSSKPYCKTHKVGFAGYRTTFINDSVIIGTNDLTTETKVDYFSIKTGRRKMGVGDLTSIPSQFDLRVKKQFLSGDIASKPDLSKFVIANNYFDEIEIYSAKGDKIIAVKGPKPIAPLFSIGGTIVLLDTKTLISYQNIYTTDNYIYISQSGKELSPDYDSGYLCDNIFVFDWNGNPITDLKLSSSIRSFAVDEKNRIIYAYSEESEGIVTGGFKL